MCILSRHDGARLCPLLHFTEPRKMLCQTLFKPTTAQGRQLPSAPTLPHMATENSDPLSEQGSARVGNLKAEIQTGVAFLRGLRFSQEAFVRPPGLNGHLCGQREKGETERRVEGDEGEQSGRVGAEIQQWRNGVCGGR